MGRGGVRRDRRQDTGVARRDRLHLGGVELGEGVVEEERDAVGDLLHVELGGEGEVRLLRAAAPEHLHAGETRQPVVDVEMGEVEQDVEQRPAHARLLLLQLGEGEAPVGEQLALGVEDLAGQREPRTRGEVDPEGHGVQEAADHPVAVRPLGAAVGEHAGDHVAAAGEEGEGLQVDRQEEVLERGRGGAGGGPQAVRDLLRDRHFQAPHQRPRRVRRPPADRARRQPPGAAAIHPLLPVEPALRRGQGLALQGHEVAEGGGERPVVRRGELRGGGDGAGRQQEQVAVEQLGEQEPDAPAVQKRLGEGELEGVVAAPVHSQAHKGGPAPVELVELLGCEPAVESLLLLRRRQMPQVLDLQGDADLLVDQVQRLGEPLQGIGAAQNGMAGHHPVERRLQPRGVEWDLEVKAGQVDQVVRAVLAMEGQPGQVARQREGVLDPLGEPRPVLRGEEVAGGRCGWPVLAGRDGGAGEGADGREPEQVLEGEAHPPLLGPGAHLDGADRVAAEGEEVVVEADSRQPEHLPPARRDAPAPPGFQAARTARRRRRRGRARAGPRGRPCRGGSAAGRGAPRRPPAPCSRAGARRKARSAAAGTGLLPRHHVGHQPPLAVRLLAGQHDRLPHPRVRRQRRLDLPQLDAEAADLDLLVDAAEVLEVAVRQPAGEVARAVEPRAGPRGERIGHEALRGQLRPAEVAAGQARRRRRRSRPGTPIGTGCSVAVEQRGRRGRGSARRSRLRRGAGVLRPVTGR